MVSRVADVVRLRSHEDAALDLRVTTGGYVAGDVAEEHGQLGAVGAEASANDGDVVTTIHGSDQRR